MTVTRGPSIVLAADCGGPVGWGHYIRCHALGAELAARGAQVLLGVRGNRPALHPEVPVVVFGRDEFPGFLRGALGGSDLVVLDLWKWDEVCPAEVQRQAILATISDRLRPGITSDIWIDPSVSSAGAGAENLEPAILGGGDYVILRNQFDGAPARDCAASPTRVLIAFGGTDQTALTALTLRALALCALPIEEITIVASEPPSLPVESPPGVRVRVVSGVDDMRRLFEWADLGVLTAGTTLFEACVTGLPSLVLSLNEDQRTEAAALARRDAVVDLGPEGEQSVETIARGLHRCLDRSFREHLARAAQSAIDGKGRVRVARSLIAAIEHAKAGVFS
jgi:spore coat polysaccharide biosynthesis predicted glycosyltransferase SpsG